MNQSNTQGFSLVELLIAMTIGIVTVAAALSVLKVNEGQKRTTSAVNDINQAGSYAIYQMDQAIRSAGTGLGHEVATSLGLPSAYGCTLNIAKNGVRIAPQNALPVPINKTSGSLRLAPVLIHDGATTNGGDVIITASGASGLAEIPTKFSNAGTSNTVLNLENNVNFNANDIVLLVGNNNANCFISQVDSGFTASLANDPISLSGNYYAAKISNIDISTVDAYVLNLGQSPNFNIFTVDTSSNLFSYNIFEPPASNTNIQNPNILISNVFQMKAIYGIDDGTGLTWVRPTGAYSIANVRSDIAKIASIKAIKLALIMRTDLTEKQDISPNRITIFSETNVSINISIPADQRNFHYQTFETTIPVRNNLIQP
jgi:type IV pilus assembly protein PilW